MFGAWSKGYKYGNTRRYLRLPAAWPIKCESPADGAGRQVTHTADVSAGGVSVTVREMIPVGGHVQLEIHIPPLDRSIQAQGKVVRCLPARGGGFSLGLQFEQIAPEDQQALREAIDRFYSPKQRARQEGAAWWRKLF